MCQVLLYNIITYDTNGGLGTVPEVINRKAGDTFAAIENSFLPPEEKRFKEWNTDAGEAGTSYMPGEMVTMPAGEMTLYAIWELIPTYKVTYVGNGNTGGSAPVDSSTYVQDDYVNISDSGSLTRSGYLLSSCGIQRAMVQETVTAVNFIIALL